MVVELDVDVDFDGDMDRVDARRRCAPSTMATKFTFTLNDPTQLPWPRGSPCDLVQSMAPTSLDPATAGEFADARLPDARLNQRLERLVELAARDPSASIPQMAGTEGEREAFYRFLNNERVSFESVLEPHLKRTVERAENAKTILAIHDTSTFKLLGSRGNELGYINTGARGFFLHATLAVENNETRACLGVLDATTMFRETLRAKGKSRSTLTGTECAALKGRESERWWTQVERVESRVEGRCQIIHVADCEADNYTLLSNMVRANFRFVTRMARDRRARRSSEEAWSHVSDLADALEHVAQREVPLSARGKKRPPLTLKKYPPRDARMAMLRFSATSMRLKRPQYLDDAYLPELELNVVHVYEVDPPTGVQPVEWFLFTTEPTRDEHEVLAVVDMYRRRWVIEDFFRAVKTGCAYEQRQLEGRHAWLVAMAITLPLAWRLMQLRQLAKVSPDAPAETALTPTEIDVLRHLQPKRMPHRATVLHALLAVAELGGHIKNNGPPGWLVLHRGLSKLQTLAEGVELARAMRPNANPEASEL